MKVAFTSLSSMTEILGQIRDDNVTSIEILEHFDKVVQVC